MIHRTVCWMLILLTVLAAAPAAARAQDADRADAKHQQFDELLARVRSASADPREAEVMRLMDLSRELGRDYAAALAVKSYLGRNYDASAKLVLAAAETARRGGDLSAAISRYKAYLSDVTPSEVSSVAAGRLFRTQLQLGKTDDAYASMKQFGDRHRQAPDARRYDRWFLYQARRRGDYPAAAQRVATILAADLPLIAERVAIGDNLDALMRELSRAQASMFDAVQPMRQIAGDIRDDKRRAARATLIAENLAYAATYAGKNEAARQRDYQQVTQAALAYVKTDPSARTLTDVIVILGGGYHENDKDFRNGFSKHWSIQQQQREQIFARAFDMLANDDERAQIIDLKLYEWPMAERVASASAWVDIAAKHPGAVRRANSVHQLPMVFQSDDAKVWDKQAGYLDKAVGVRAAAMRALAAGDGAVEPTLKHLFAKENWHLTAGQFTEAIDKFIWPALSGLPRQEQDKLTDAAMDQALAKLGREHIATTPLAALNRELASRYLRAAWLAAEDPFDRKPFVEDLKALDWVPWNKEHRKLVIQDAYNQFRNWVDQLRKTQASHEKKITSAQAAVKRARDEMDKLAKRVKELEGEDGKAQELTKAKQDLNKARTDLAKAEKSVEDARAQTKGVAGAMEQIGDLDAAFKRSFDPAVSQKAKAPGKLAAQYATFIAALNEADQKAYEKAARDLYPMVREYETGKKVAFGTAVLARVLADRDKLNTFDLAVEFFADQLGRWEPGLDDQAIAFTIESIVNTRGEVEFWRTSRGGRDSARKLAATLEEALIAQIDRGQFYDRAFTWLRSFRDGRGWNARRGKDSNVAVMKKMIESRVMLEISDYRIAGDFAAPTYQWLIENRWHDLDKQYNPERYFDDMFLAEAKKAGWMDEAYFRYGEDKARKLADHAAELFAKYEALPLPYGDRPTKWSRSAVFRWQRHALKAHAEPRDKMIEAIESRWGKTRYDNYAAGHGYFEAANSDLTDAKERAEYFDRLKVFVDRADQMPQTVTLPPLRDLRKVQAGSLSEEELKTLLSVINVARPDEWRVRDEHAAVPVLLLTGLDKQRDLEHLPLLVSEFWAMSRDRWGEDLRGRLLAWTQNLLKQERYTLAVVSASTGLDILGGAVSTDFQDALRTVQARANAQVSGVIPVARNDPRYPMFAAQADFLSGKLESAWKNYQENRALLLKNYREFDPTFSIWLIQRHTQRKQFDQAEQLAQQMLVWFDERSAAVDPELRAQLRLTYANLAVARKEYPSARARFEGIAAGKAFDGTRGQKEARIMVARVDRLMGRYDEATRALEEIIRENPRGQTFAEALYELALVKFDQEEYKEAGQYVKRIYAARPQEPLAKILEAQINLKLRKLEEPTEIDIGTVTQKQYIVPGKVLKIGLEDPNLTVVGQSSMIELRAWTDSGDEELLTLTPFGDSKTRFRGELVTDLAPTSKQDGRLQVLGSDTVYYDFSEDFRRVNNVRLDRPKSLRVVSTGQLYASTGEILSQDERRERELEAEIRRVVGQAGAPGDQPRRSRQGNVVKPGNRINVRVIDPDRSTTADVDQLPVRVTSSSGDVIDNLVLTETGSHTGVFEGIIQTAAGSAIAYASDTSDGRDPNFAISAKEYPAWVALQDAQRPKWYSVDLNDRVLAGQMKIVASEPGRKLKSFVVEVSLNGRDYQTVGQYPGEFKPWDGAARVEAVQLPNDNLAKNPDELRTYLLRGHIGKDEKKIKPIKELSTNWDVNGVRKMGLGWGWNGYRFRAAFFQAERRVRQFKVEAKGKRTNVHLFVNGEYQKGGEFQGSLERGVHTIEVVGAGWREMKFDLMTDAAEPPFTQKMPAEQIDVTQHPQIQQRLTREPAEVVVDDAGETFTVDFGQDTHVRVVRLHIVDFQTDAPAINRMELTDIQGERILPTNQDFMEMRRNQTLEIVPGDQVRVTYRDPRGVESDDELHQASLEARYTDAEVIATFPEVSGKAGQRKTERIELRRFEPGDAISIVIDDPDMDVSNRPDTVAFTVITDSGKSVKLEALETGPYSGQFTGRIFPITGTAQRESEIPVSPGEGLRVSYLDEHNTDPGVPWDRHAVLEQTIWMTPELRVYQTQTLAVPAEQIEKQIVAAAEGGLEIAGEEFVPDRYTLLAVRPALAEQEKTTATPSSMGIPVTVELLWPTIAKSEISTATLYAQTSSGRAQAGLNEDAAFDINVPGTIKVQAQPNDEVGGASPVGYADVQARGDMYATDPVSDGRFNFRVPLLLGSPGDKSLAVEGEWADQPARPGGDEEAFGLKVNGDDEVYLGFKYETEDGTTAWITRRVQPYADPLVDVTDRRYQQIVRKIQVGQTLYFRVIDPKRDVSDEKDEFDLPLTAESGGSVAVRMSETFSHSGVFKGLIQVQHREEMDEAAAEDQEQGPAEAAPAEGDGDGDLPAVEAFNAATAVPVLYGDAILARYAPQRERIEPNESIERRVTVSKGDAALVLAFTKRFEDQQIAVQTQFTMAEAFFELAKRHRKLGNKDLARVKVLQGKKLLEEALMEFTESAMRAQAEYLLANLSMEFGDDAKNVETKKRFYNEAVSRFSDLVASYPDSEYAPKAQYQKALVYEKMSEFQPSLIDRASEEYVKLSYRYPDNELVADTIVRLGNYFRNKGRSMRDEAAALDEQGKPVDAEKLRVQAREMFVTASRVLSRLSKRFPQHNLSGKTLVVAGQCAMQGDDYELATTTFNQVVEDKSMDSDLRAMAMYWSARAYLETKDYKNAYINLKKCEWDYPATDWAKFARGLLATNPQMIKMDEQN